MIEFRTLGGLDLRDSQGRELRAIFSAPKRAGLLTYLAIATPHGFHRRDTLLALLWPELDHEHARRSLRQALYLIRRSVTDGTLLSPGDEEVGLDRDAFRCDAVAFEQLLDDGRLEEALALYRGELLEGFHLSGCLEFERWLDHERRRLKDRAAEAARSLAEQAVAEGRTPQAAQWGRRALALSPNDEGVLQRVIALLDRAGDRAGAIREYEAFAKRLREDYEVEPAPETTALIESVRAREQANGAVLPSAPVTKQAAAAPVTSVTVEARRSWRTRRLAAGAIVALGAVTVAGATVIRNGRGNAPALDPTRVLVDMFRNETGDPSLDHLGRMATDRVTAGLTVTSFVDVVNLGAAVPAGELFLADTGDPNQNGRLLGLARASGAGMVVSGSYYLQGDSVHLHARVTDARTGNELATIDPARGRLEASADAIEELRDRVMTTLAMLTDPRLANWIAHSSKPPTFQAYKDFVDGTDLLLTRKDFREAHVRLMRAAASDSSFTMPLLWTLSGGGFGIRDSVLTLLIDRREQMAPVDRHFLDYKLARERGDAMGMLRAMRRLVRIAPGNYYLELAASAANNLNRPRESIEFLNQAGPSALWNAGSGWSSLAIAHHMLGDYRAELEVARRALEQHPDDIFALHDEARALAALGRMDDVNAVINDVVALSHEPPVQSLYGPGRLMRNITAELRAHGHGAAASALLDRAIDWYQRRPLHLGGPSPDERCDPACFVANNERSGLARVLYMAGRLDEARAIAEPLVQDAPGPPRHALLGAIAAAQGDRDKALEMSVELEGRMPANARNRGRYIIYRAAILTNLGELEQAVALLGEGTGQNAMAHSRHLLEPLWDYPPFQELIRPKG